MLYKAALVIIICVVLDDINSLKSELRIIGGNKVENRSLFPFQVLLRYKDAPFCGGTIIDEKHVLTAAHCCISKGYKLSASDLAVVVGNLYLNDKPMVKSVQYVFTHEDYSSTSQSNDIALLRIFDSFGNWTQNVRPINLTTQSVETGSICIVSGWGTLQWQSKVLSQWLYYVHVPIVNWTMCHQNYYYFTGTSLGENALCAGENGKDSCQGDSGGPLVCKGTLSGIVSYGPTTCGLGLLPGVYTEVAKYVEWIEQQKLRTSSALDISGLSLILLINYLLVQFSNFLSNIK